MVRQMSLVMLAVSCSSAALAGSVLPGAPTAKAVPLEESVQGIKVSDPYRWMESGGDEYTAWLKAQGAAADAWLTKLPMRAKLLGGIEARSGAIEGVGSVRMRGRYVFVSRRPVGAQVQRLTVREGIDGTERVLFDPQTLDTATAKGHSINYWDASPDGRHVYLGVSPGGSESAVLKVIETASGRFIDADVPQAVLNGNGQWLPDGSGFFYNRLAEGADPQKPGYYLNSRLFLRKIGTGTANDKLLVTRGMAGAPEMLDLEMPFVTIASGSSTAVLNISDGVGRSMRLFVAPAADAIAGTAKWTPIGSRADEIESFASVGRDLYLVRRNQPRGRVVVLRDGATSIANAVEVVPHGDGVVEQVSAAREGVYVIGRNAQGADLRLLRASGAIVPVALPFSGASYFADSDPAMEGLTFSLESYVTPRRFLVARAAAVSDTGLGPKVPFAVDPYISETVIVTARDGTKVPVDVVRRKDLPKDGKRPVLLDAYGAYGVSGDPYFNPRLYALLDAGGIYATAKVRGGGEFGRDWWLAGKGPTKPNTWRDAIDSAEWFLKSGWTSQRRIALWGTSAGGIMAGRSVTERPDLWAGAIVSVGVMNMLRFEATPNGKTNIAEFGTIETPEGARALYAMDAYHAIKPGTAYPPMLLTAGANDPRVVAWQPAKFVARMQAEGAGGPFVFDVDFDQGHGIGSTRSQLDQKAAEVGAFALWAAARAD